jgi:cytochrome P450
MSASTAISAAKTRPGSGTRGLPVLGNSLDFQRDPIRLFFDLRRDYGDFSSFRVGPDTLYLATHPEYVQYLLQNNYRNYVRGKYYRFFGLFLGRQSLFSTEGDIWLQHRRLSQPAFYRPSLARFASTMVELTGQMLENWDKYASTGQDFDVVPELMSLSLRITGQSLFDVDLAAEAAEVMWASQVWSKSLVRESIPLLDKLPRWLPLPHHRRVQKAQRIMNRVADRVLAAYQDGTKTDAENFVAMLLASRDEKTGRPLSHAQLRDDLKTAMLAGHETTGTALAWIFYSLSRHPQVRAKLEAELDRVLGDRLPTAEDLPALVYTRMVIEESLRLHPPVWGFVRAAIKEDMVDGHRIPAGSSIFFSPYIAHRDPRYWENPEAFDPERFAPGQSEKRPRFAYFPFGGGPHLCIGNHFAMLEMQMVVATVAQRYRLHPLPGHPIYYSPQLSLRPVQGVRTTVHRRMKDEG